MMQQAAFLFRLAVKRLEVTFAPLIIAEKRQELTSNDRVIGGRTPYRILCNDLQWEVVKTSPGLEIRFFCYVLLHKIRYGV
jgi:hypothetical protein